MSALSVRTYILVLQGPWTLYAYEYTLVDYFFVQIGYTKYLFRSKQSVISLFHMYTYFKGDHSSKNHNLALQAMSYNLPLNIFLTRRKMP